MGSRNRCLEEVGAKVKPFNRSIEPIETIERFQLKFLIRARIFSEFSRSDKKQNCNSGLIPTRVYIVHVTCTKGGQGCLAAK